MISRNLDTETVMTEIQLDGFLKMQMYSAILLGLL